MRVKLARTAGFCMGVRRAMNMAQDAAAEGGKPVYTYGPIIHNAQAVEVLESKGIRVTESVDEMPPGRLVIRAHGISPGERARLEGLGFECIDATCPHVLRSQQRIQKASREGRAIVLVGDPDHAETLGLAGYASGPVRILSTPAEAEALALDGPVSVLAQTTFNAETYGRVADILRREIGDCEVFDSICLATSERQAEARKLSQSCDAVVVVGGRHSANSLRLAAIARESGKPVFHVETAGELDPEAFTSFRIVGVTAGASTPGWLTQAVIHRLQDIQSRGATARLMDLAAMIVKSYLYSALAAVCLAHAVVRLMGASAVPAGAYFSIFAYIFTVYTINRRTAMPPLADELPALDAFYEKWKGLLFALAGGLTAAGLALAWRLSHGLFLLLCLAYLGGVIYAVPILPRGYRWRRLKDIPASKDIFTAGAWAVVVLGMPLFLLEPSLSLLSAFGTGVLVFLLVFGKTVALDLRDTEGDRLIGSETIPILIGTGSTLRLLYLVQTLALALLLGFSLGGVFPSLGFALLALPAYAILYLRLFPQGLLTEEVRCQAIVDGQFLLAGAIAISWG
ncbi:MAG: 4-hydroxy-3-methylbut-2-enyl diphosphate reductase [Planctomycetota bacterium]